MKKVIATLLCFVVFHFANAQTLLYESFENGFPTNWLNVDADYDGFSWQLMSVTNDGVRLTQGIRVWLLILMITVRTLYSIPIII